MHCKKIALFAFFFFIAFCIHTQSSIRMEYKNGVYYLPCEINNLKLKFVFDTGASDCSISLTEAIFMLKNNYMNESDLLGSTYSKIANGEIIEGTKVILRAVKIGDKILYNVEASIVHSLSAPLLLGQSAIKKLGKFQFDYSTSTLTIGISNAYTSTQNFVSTETSSINASYQKIRDKKISKEYVSKILGKPSSLVVYDSTSEKWYYGEDLIYFENGYIYEYENQSKKLDKLLMGIK